MTEHTAYHSMSYCRWINDKEIGRWHLPGCMGGAVYGPSGCTCPKRRRKKELEEVIAAMDERIKKLEAAMKP